MKNGVYEGGIPTNGTTLYPTSKSDMVEKGETPGGGGEGRINARPGTPPAMNGTYVNQFVDQSSYQTDMEIGREGSMKVRNPDDISHSDGGKMP